MKDIKGRVAFVTGGAKGLGFEIAKKFAEEGAKVVVFDIDSEQDGAKIAETLNAITDGAKYIKGDVTDSTVVKAAMKTIKDTYGKLDFAVNNAGIVGEILPFMETGEAQYDKVMAVNVKGVFVCMQGEIELMQENGFGKIVNVSSEAGAVGIEGFSTYIASKHAVNGLTKTVAIECATKGINVNAIAPGTMDTPLVVALPQDVQETLANCRPSKRLNSVENVAAMAVYLCSSYASDAVGSIVSLDGGYTVQ